MNLMNDPRFAGLFAPRPTMRAWRDPTATAGGGQVGPAQPVNGLLGSAGVFADYMRQNMVKKGPTFMPPQLGRPSTPTIPTGPIMGGGPEAGGAGLGTDGVGVESGGLLGGGRASFGPDGMVSAQSQTGMSDNLAGALAGLLGGLLGVPGLGMMGRGINGSVNGMATEANAARASQIDTNPDLNGTIGGFDAYGSGFGGGGNTGGGGDLGSSTDAGSTGAGADTGGPAGSGGDGTGSGGDVGGDGPGWARGGMVTKNRLKGKNPAGPDDGYGALDVGEAVIPKKTVKKHPKLVAGLLRG